MTTALVTGSSSGLGAAIAGELGDPLFGDVMRVIEFDAELNHDVRSPLRTYGKCPPIDILVNCAGVNQIDWLEDVSEEAWSLTMGVNAGGIFKMTQWALDSLAESKGTIVNIVSNASHMPMTASLAYNASKAAAHMMTLQLARELTPKYGITVFGVSPNKLADTEMSRYVGEKVKDVRGWTDAQARDKQRSALITGKETPVERVSEFIAFLLSRKERHLFLSGTVIPYGA